MPFADDLRFTPGELQTVLAVARPMPAHYRNPQRVKPKNAKGNESLYLLRGGLSSFEGKSYGRVRKEPVEHLYSQHPRIKVL